MTQGWSKANEVDHTDTSEPICPACGHAFQDAFEWPDEGTRRCRCGATFKWERDVSVTYSTELPSEGKENG